MNIHKTAIVDPNAIIGEGVKIGAYSIIEDGVEIGDGCEIGSSVSIKRGTRMGKNNKICESVIIGGLPQDVQFKGGESFVTIGNDNIIREFVTIHRATTEDGETIIGDNNFLMAYCHIGHDVSVGNRVIIANATQISGFAEIQDFAFLSGLCPVHQFIRMGRYSIVGGGYRIPKDVLPYSLSAGDPLRVIGLNILGLRRHNFGKDTINILKKAFALLLSKELNTSQAIQKIKEQLPEIEEIKEIITFIESSKRGVAI